jgi:flagellar FliJ protein
MRGTFRKHPDPRSSGVSPYLKGDIMPSFHFRLETFLNVKKQLEKGIKNELGVAVQKMEQQKRILSDIQTEIASQESEYQREGSAGSTLEKLKQRMEYIRVMRKRESAQKDRVKEEMKNVDKIRERLIEVMKEKKVLEKLKEKELALFRKEQEKAGQLLVDELVSFKESRKPIEDKG